MSELVYCATPSRMAGQTEKIIDFVVKEGYAPLHPIQALPYEAFEGNPNVGRKKTMEYCQRLIDISDRFWMFGVSEGTMDDLSYARGLEKKLPVRLVFDGFDVAWEEFYKNLRSLYNNHIDSVFKEYGEHII